MQLIAEDKNKKLILAEKAHKKTDYNCIECNQRVRIRSGVHRRAHFFHCNPDKKCYLHEKSLVHIQNQYYIYSLFPEGDCELEYQFPSINRRADVVWFREKIVFEIQCSFISEQELLERNRDYKCLGWSVIWIFHDRFYNQKRLRACEMAIDSLHYFSNIDENGQGYIYDQFSIFHQGFRQFKMPPLAVTLNQIFYYQHLKLNFLKIVIQRMRKNSCYFKGDLSYLCDLKLQIDYLDKIKNFEEKEGYAKQRKIKFIFFGVFFHLRRLLNSFFCLFLEKFCK